MNEWGVFLVIVAITNFIATILTVFVRPSTKNSIDTVKVIQQNTIAITSLTEKLDDLTSTNTKDHNKFYKDINQLKQDTAVMKEKHHADIEILKEHFRKD